MGGLITLSRRAVLGGLAGLGASATGLALLSGCGLLPFQAESRVARVVYLGPTPEDTTPVLREGLRHAGWIEGQNLTFESHMAVGSEEWLPALLADMTEILGPRPAAVARELTKLFEEVRRAELGELAAHYAAAGHPRGEVVVVVGPPAKLSVSTDANLDEAIGEALSRLRLRDAVDAVAATTGMARRKIYARALQLAGKPFKDVPP